MKKMYYVTEEFLVLGEWLGYRGSNGVSLSINGIDLDLDFLGFIYEQIDNAYRGGPHQKTSNLEPIEVPISGLNDPNPENPWEDEHYTNLVKLDLLEEAGLILPKGVYHITIGEFLEGSCTMEEDTPLKSTDDVFGGLVLNGLHDGFGKGIPNVRVLAQIDTLDREASKRPWLICKGFVHDIQGRPKDPTLSPAMFLDLGEKTE